MFRVSLKSWPKRLLLLLLEWYVFEKCLHSNPESCFCAQSLDDVPEKKDVAVEEVDSGVPESVAKEDAPVASDPKGICVVVWWGCMYVLTRRT